MKSSSIVETSSAKDEELDWANEVENNIKTEKVSKLSLLSKGKNNKETCTKAQSTNQLVSNIDATSTQKKLQDNSLESISQNTDSLGQDSLVNAVTDAASNNITKKASNSGLTKNSDSSEVEKDNNIEEVTFIT
ncbi:12651_t:CDS:2, partial [Cetraspora pellucida]